MKLDPVSLKLFVAIVEEGTIAEAAAREHMATSAVSKRVSELEGQLDVALLRRSNRGIEPTAAGYALAGMARGVLQNLDDISLQMRGYAAGTRGHVRIFANISAITQFLPAEIESFLAMHPNVEVRLEERISQVIVKAVAENAADIGLITVGDYGHDVQYLPYHDDNLIVVVPRGHPLARRRKVSFSEALQYEFVGAHTGSAINNALGRAASEAGMPLKMRIQVTSYDALCLMVQAGLGIGVMPRQSAMLYLKALGLREVALAEPWADRNLAICVRAYDSLPVATRLLVDHLRNRSEVPAGR
jgi:DNA-binding transcriptional LysR family regulator